MPASPLPAAGKTKRPKPFLTIIRVPSGGCSPPRTAARAAHRPARPRSRDRRICRFGLSRYREVQKSKGSPSELAHRDDAGQAPSVESGSGLWAVVKRGRKSQSWHPRKGRTSVPSHQVSVQIHKGSIPWPGKENSELADVICAEQSVDGSQASTARTGGISPSEII